MYEYVGTCPTYDTLLEYTTGNANDSTRREIDLHIENCDQCINLLDEINSHHNTKYSPRRLKEATNILADIKAGPEYQQSFVNNCKNILNIHPDCVSHLDGEFADFKIIREISRGGMGVVYEAIQLSMKRKVALKILPYSVIGETIRKTRFQIESQALAMLQHDNIIPIYHTGEVRGNPYFVMPFIDGVNLDCFIKMKNSSLNSSPHLVVKQLNDSVNIPDGCTETQHFNPDEFPPKPSTTAATTSFELNLDQFESVANKEQGSFKFPHQSDYFDTVALWGIQALSALQHAHVMGVIHRDVKPANMLINESGHLWLTDFGLAKISVSAGITNTGAVMGTARYMSPEQASGNQEIITHQTDIYSLGVSLYELVTETHFYPDSNNIQQIHNVLNIDPVRPRKINPQIPKDFETIILKATSKEIKNRYSSASEMGADLQRMRDNIPIHASHPGIYDKFSKLCKRYRVASATILVSFVVVSVLSFIFMLIFSTKNSDLRKLNNKYELSLIEIRQAKQKTELANKETNQALKKTSLALQEAREKNYINTIKMASAATKEKDSSRVISLLSLFKPKKDQADIRGLEWFVLNNNEIKIQEEIKLSPDPLYAICKNSRKKLIATAGLESKIYILDSDTLEIINTIRTHQIEINGLDFNKAGTLIASTGDDGTVQLWNTGTGKNELTITVYPRSKEENENKRVLIVKFTPDEKHLITSANDSMFKMWDLSTGNLAGEFKGHQDQATIFDISKDGKLLVTGGFDRSIRIWRIQDQKQIDKTSIPALPTGSGHVMTVALSKDQKNIVIGSRDNAVYLWKIFSGKRTLIGFHDDPVESLFLSENEREVIVTDRSGTIKIWSLKNDIDLKKENSPQPLYSQLLHKGKVYDGFVGSKSTEFLSVGEDGYLRKSYIEISEPNRDLLRYEDIGDYSYSQKSDKLAFYTPDKIFILKQEGQKFVPYWEISVNKVSSIHLSKDGQFIVAGYENGKIRLWNCKEKKHITYWTAEKGKVITDVVISPDKKHLAYSIENKSIKVHDLENLRIDQVPPKINITHDLNGYSPEFSNKDGILAYRYNNSVVIWNCKTRKIVQELTNHVGGINGFLFLDDGRKMIVSDNNRSIHIWNVDDGTQTCLPWKHNSILDSMAITPDGTTLITTDKESKITYWNFKNGQPLHSINYRMCNSITLLNTGRLLTFGNHHALETLNFGEAWTEYWDKNLKWNY